MYIKLIKKYLSKNLVNFEKIQNKENFLNIRRKIVFISRDICDFIKYNVNRYEIVKIKLK